jgi:hypothetical protein
MTIDDIIRSFLALHPDTPIDGREYAIPLRVISRILEAAIKLEREACAKVCEDASKPHDGEMHSDSQWAGLVLAVTIRARGNK